MASHCRALLRGTSSLTAPISAAFAESLRTCAINSDTLKVPARKLSSANQTLNAADCNCVQNKEEDSQTFGGPRGGNPAAQGHQRGTQSSIPFLRLVLLGGPGVGKGTYGNLLSRTFGIPHISTGDLIRAELAKSGGDGVQTRRQELLRAAVDKGNFVPDGTVAELLEEHMSATCHNAGYILDGFPRTVPQARLLEEMLPSHLAIHLTAVEEALVAKSLGRRTCGQCGRAFNLAHVVGPGLNLPARFPPVECTGKMTWRSDDADVAVVRQRLRLYEKESRDVVEYYRKEGKLLDLEVGVGVTLAWPRLLQHIDSILAKAINTTQDFHHHSHNNNNHHFCNKNRLHFGPNSFLLHHHHSCPPPLHFYSYHCRPKYASSKLQPY